MGQVEIFNYGLQLAFVRFGHFATEDHGDLLGLANAAIQVQESFREFLHRGPTMADEIVTVFHLREEQTVLTTSLLALPIGKAGGECGQPLLAASQ
jgi:hypothetical protein